MDIDAGRLEHGSDFDRHRQIRRGNKKYGVEGAVETELCVCAWAPFLDYKPSPQMSQQSEVNSLISHY